MKFQINQTYSRKDDIHGLFGGQQQGGISTPSSHPFVFLFTGDSGAAFGYQDGWIDEACFAYTGEGQLGDMEFVRGNRAIRDHVRDRKTLLLFETTGKGKPVVFRGQFFCQSWEYFEGADAAGKARRSIRFHLIRYEHVPDSETEGPLRPTDQLPRSFEALRVNALAVSATPSTAKPEVASRNYFQRSHLVREYVLARAGGVCELTGRRAPFVRKNGTPYLEVHHTHMLSDDGPDHPLYVAAIHPASHREIHYGVNGEALNNELIAKVARIESALDEDGLAGAK